MKVYESPTIEFVNEGYIPLSIEELNDIFIENFS